MRAMQGIKAGTFWINDPLTDNDAGPFGGMRWSGIGRELGEEGLDAFREPKHVHLDYVMERKDYWYPTVTGRFRRTDPGASRPRPERARDLLQAASRSARSLASLGMTAGCSAPPAQSLGSSIAISSASKLPRLVHRRVLPRRQRRQAHEHALDPGVGLQPEQRAPVVHQVELDVPAPPRELEPPLALAVGQRPAAARRSARTPSGSEPPDVQHERHQLVERQARRPRPAGCRRRCPPMPRRSSPRCVFTK